MLSVLLVLILTFINIVHTGDEVICPSLCTKGINPPCRVCCVEEGDVGKLDACIKRFNFYNGDDFSGVNKIVVAGGVYNFAAPIDLNVDGWISPEPMMLLPMDENDVVFSIESGYIIDTSVSNWHIGSLKGGKFVFDGLVKFTEKSQNLMFFNTNFVESLTIGGADDAFVGFKECSFQVITLASFMGGKAMFVDNSIVQFNANMLVDSELYLDGNTIGDIFVRGSVVGEFTWVNNIIGCHLYIIASPVKRRSDEEPHPAMLMYNNLFMSNCGTRRGVESLIVIDGTMSNIELYNNVFNKDSNVNLIIDWTNVEITSGSCQKDVLKGRCTISNNYVKAGFSPDVFPNAANLQIDAHTVVFEVDVLNKVVMKDDQGNDITKSCNGVQGKTPLYDKDHILRQNTLSPTRVGPWSGGECLPNIEGPLCDDFYGQHEDIDVKNPISTTWFNNLLMTEEQRRLFKDLPFTMTSICINEYWGAAVDSEYNLYMWGEEIDNDYILEDSEGLIKIDLDADLYTRPWKGKLAEDFKWKFTMDIAGETKVIQDIPKKVVCTQSGVFVLSYFGNLYVMGRNLDHEIEGDRKLTSFHLTQTGVYNVEASYHTAYVLYEETVDVKYCAGTYDELSPPCDDVQTVPVHRIEAIGMNYFGAVGSNYVLEHTAGTYEPIKYSYISPGVKHPLVDTLDTDLQMSFGEYKPSPMVFLKDGIPLYPEIKPIEHGFMLLYRTNGYIKKNWWFFCGKDHPSTEQDESELVLIDWSEVDSTSEITNEDIIDFIDRLYDGCLYIVAEEKVYISGSAGCGQYGMQSNPKYKTPFELPITGGDYEYGDYNHELVYDFRCGFACYMITKEGIFMFGRSDNGMGLNADCGANKDCNRITLASTEVSQVLPGVGNTIPNAETLGLKEKYDILMFNKPSVWNTFTDEVVYKYPPVLLSDSGMEENQFTLNIRRPEVWYERETDIFFEYFDELTGEWMVRDNLGIGNCMYPYITPLTHSQWEHYNEDLGVEKEGPFAFFKLVLPWTDHRVLCGWEYDPTYVDIDGHAYDLYSNRLALIENYYTGMRYGQITRRTEKFVFDLQIRFPKEVLKSEIIVQQDEFSEYWDAYIVDKTFDRDTRKGMIEFATVTRFPNFFVFPERAIEFAELTHLPQPHNHVAEGIFNNLERLGDPSPDTPQYFNILSDDYYLIEVGGESTPETKYGSRRGYRCDAKNCYQSFQLFFEIIDDYRVCHVPTTTFPVYWVQYCNLVEMTDAYHIMGDASIDHEDCVNPSREVEFDISLSIDNLCGGELIENIETIFTLTLYTDWTYTEEIDTDTHVFNVGDWLYFKAVVSCDEVTIDKTVIDTIVFVDGDGAYQKLWKPNVNFAPGMDTHMLTTMGMTVKLVIDDLESDTEVGFHFH